MSSSWFIVSKALDKSINNSPVKPCSSRQNYRLSIGGYKAYCVLKPLLYPHIKGEKIFEYSQKSVFALLFQIS